MVNLISKLGIKKLRIVYFLQLVFLVLFAFDFMIAQNTKDLSVQIRVKNIDTPNKQIQLTWDKDSLASKYTILKKLKDETIWKNIGKMNMDSTFFVDYDVEHGKGYEYFTKKVILYIVVMGTFMPELNFQP